MEMEGSIQKNLASKVIIGIDFGTSGIAFAYGFLDDPDKKVYQGHFSGKGQNAKIPSEIILDNDLKEVKAFGLDCSSYINQNNSNEYNHFKKIKMHLYNKSYIIKSNNQGKEANIELIIRLMLIEIKKKVIEEIKQSYPQLVENNCRFVITVPAIWDYKSKQVMLESAKNAKLFNEEDEIGTFFALEPEAASIYYNKDSFSYANVIATGRPFILCDLGGGTVDIVVQKKIQINNDIQFEELYPPVGGNNGSNRINELFIDNVIKVLFGENTFNTVKNQIDLYVEWIKFEDEIEQFKKNTNFQINQEIRYYTINCEIFEDYSDGKSITSLIEEYNKKCKESWKIKQKRKWVLDFPYNIMNDLMDQILEDVLKYIKEIQQNIQVKALVFSGGASKSALMVNKIQNLDNIFLDYVKSHNPEVAISLGSVHYAFQRNIISIRKAKYTIGIGFENDWIEEYEGKGKKIEINGNFYCENLFSKFITKNQNIPYDQVIRNYYFMDSPMIIIDLYKTNKDNPTFIDEKDDNGNLIVSKFGEIILDVKDKFDPNSKEVIVEMKFGGTFISISAKYVKNNERVHSLFVLE